MCPTIFFGKSSQETGCSYAASFAATNVLHVCKSAIDLALVVLPDGQAPGSIVAQIAGVNNFLRQVVIVCKYGGRMTAQGYNTGAGQGGDINYRSGIGYGKEFRNST